MKKLTIQQGQIFGKLQIISEIPKELRKKERRFILKCHCGTQIQVDLNHLKAGRVISCGCEHKKILSLTHTTHGQSKTKLYKIWRQIKTKYGMHDSWINSFKQFKNDIPEYIKGLTINRIDNTKGYEPGNIKWSTNLEQQNNKRNTIFIETGHGKESLANLCRQYGCAYNTIYHYRFQFNKIDKEVMIKLQSKH